MQKHTSGLRWLETSPLFPERDPVVAERCRLTPLDATPLADTIRDLRAELEAAANVTRVLAEEKEAALEFVRRVRADGHRGGRVLQVSGTLD